MNCDDFLPAMEMDDPAHAEEAGRHAGSCPRCAAAYTALLKIKATLAVHKPLSVAARVVWENASRAPAAQSTRQPRWAPALAGILTSAAACAVVFLLVISRPGGEPVRLNVGLPANPTTIIEHDPAVELAQLAAAVEALDSNLVALAEHAERLDVEREISLTLNQYKRW